MATKTATAKIGGKIKKEEPKEEVVTAKSRRTGGSKWKADQIITLLVDYNPKRASSESHARFENYEDGMSVEEALEAGLTNGDLNWDTAHDFIKIGDELDEDAEKKSKPVKASKVEVKPVTGKVTIIPKTKGKKKKAEVEAEEDEDC